MNNQSLHYPSKLMLFGEYAVIAGGEGLAIPYPTFSAQWIMNTNSSSEYKPHLIRFLEWLKENNFDSLLQLSVFENDLQHGLDMASNVPVGYGVGSSGVVVAAIYDKYVIQRETDIQTLKQILASMENYFHATSSGLDPLVCYLNKAVHVKPNSIDIATSNFQPEKIRLGLIDCGNARSTQQLVTVFKEKMLNETFASIMQDYIHLSNTCIKAWLTNDEQLLITHLKLLSALQLQYFGFAIPEKQRKEWKNKLDSNTGYMKLCGAGGGGFLINFATC